MTLVVNRGEPYEYRDLDSGAAYFSFSQVAKVLDPDAFSGISQDVMDRASERGRRLHYLFAFALAHRGGHGEMPPRPEDVTLAPYYDAMVGFLDAYQVRPVKIEEPSCNRKVGYAGTPDALVVLRIMGNDMVALLDLKTGGPRRCHRVQLQAYRRMEGYEKIRPMRTLYLKPDGRFELVRVEENPADWAWFLCGVGVLKGRRNP